MHTEIRVKRPKKSLGQNFLTSIPARNAIIESGKIKKGEIIVEVGPGKGMLTKGLLDAGAKVIAIEKDRELIDYLHETFSRYKNLTILEGDILTFEPPAEYKLIANIPYYITGAIFEKFLSHKNQPKSMVVLIQKEVAERITQKDGKHSILSLSVCAYGTPKIVYRVNKGSFYPIPKVDSAVLLIENISRKNFKDINHEEIFFKLIHSGFAHKRKLLARNLEANFNKKDILMLWDNLNLSKNIRAEDVNINTWLTLSHKLSTLE